MLSAETAEAFTEVLAQQAKPKGLSLHDLTDELLALDTLAEMDQGEWTDEHDALGKELFEKIARKTDGAWEYRLLLKKRAENAKEYANAILAKAKREEARADTLDTYIMAEMERSGRGFLEGERWKIRAQKNSTPALVIEVLPAALPPEYQKPPVPVVIEANTAAIVAALKAGVEVTGCSLSYGKHLRAS